MKKLMSFIVVVLLFSSFLLGGEWNLGYQFNQPLSDGLEVIHLNSNQVLVCVDHNWYIIDAINNVLIDSGLLDYPIERAAYAWLNEEELMIIGGYWEGSLIADCQVLNLSSQICYTLPYPMNYGRFYHSAGKINGGIYDGYPITGGGYGAEIGNTWEMMNLSTMIWTEIAECPIYRRDFNLNICNDGKVVTSAGISNDGTITIYDADTNSWTEISCNIIFGESSASTNFNNNQVFITNGQIFGSNYGFSNKWLIFDVNSESIIANGIYPTWFPARACASVELLANDNIMISCGSNPDYGYALYSCATFNPNTQEWISEAETNFSHISTTCLTTDNRIFLASDTPYAYTEIYSWNTAPYVSELIAPETGFTGQELNFDITVLDSENDSLSIRLNYDYPDTTAITEWTELVSSGYTFEMINTWETSGTYEIYIQTKDIYEPMNVHNSLSDWTFLFSIVISDPINSEDNEVAIPINFIQNYPNPFNPTTTISFSVTQNSDFVTLEIYNLKGQKVKTLPVILSDAQHRIEGNGNNNYSVTWNGTDQNNQPVSSGIYFYKLKSGDYEMSRKMLLLK